MPLTVDQLRERLAWQHVVRESARLGPPGYEFDWVIFKILPSNPDWPSIDLIFDDTGEFIQSVHFSEAHWHHDSASEEAENVAAAIRGVAPLVHHRECLVECLDATGQYCSADGLPLDGIPRMIQKRVQQFRRVIFDREPVIEPIDFSRYVEQTYHFVLAGPDPDTVVRRQKGWPASPCRSVATDRWQESQVTGHDDGTVRLWELEPTRMPVWILRGGHEGGVTAVDWGPDDRCLSGGRDGTMVLWSAEAPTLDHRFEGHRAPIRRVAWHADQWRAASWAEDGEIRVWNTEARRLVEAVPAADRDCQAAVIGEFFAIEPPVPDDALSEAYDGVWDVHRVMRFEVGALDDWQKELRDHGL